MAGLGDRVIKESSERIHAAIIQTGYEFPKMKIVVNLAPGDVKKRGSHFDLGMAIGLLLQSKQIVANVDIKEYGFIGELSLNGLLRPCAGVLPMVIATKKSGIKNIIVPKENIGEASLVKGIKAYGLENLRTAIEFLEGKGELSSQIEIPDPQLASNYPMDFSDVKGQDVLIEYIVVAAAGGYTIVVLANGLDICYPPEHIELMEGIIENGAVISEYPPGVRPNPKYFPRRNLIISAWSEKILVIEAGARSGSLITAKFGKEYGREVLSLPASIYRPESKGSNKLLANGAKIYLHKEDLLIENRYRPIANRKDEKTEIQSKELDELEGSILEILSKEGTISVRK